MTAKGAVIRNEMGEPPHGPRTDDAQGSLPAPGTGEPAALRFADFELRLDSGELTRAGAAVKLQPRPARVLELLIRHAGEVVSREEIRRAVWGEETYIDFDLALNFCIRQIRGALSDSAESPRFVATIPRRGYRFLAPVEEVSRAPEGHHHAPEAGEPHEAEEPHEPRHGRSRLRYLVAACLATLALALSPAMPPEPARGVPAAAMRSYLRGRDLLEHGDAADAVTALQEATILAPSFAPAYASLAEAFIDRQLPAAESLSPIETTVSRALALDPNLPLAHFDLAESRTYYRFDWAGAEAEYRAALRLDPDDPERILTFAVFLTARGRADEALRQAERARALAPDSLTDNPDFAWFYYLNRRYDEAIRQAQRTLSLAKSSPEARQKKSFLTYWSYHVIMLSELAQGNRQMAFAMADEEQRWEGKPPLASLAEFWDRQGAEHAPFKTPFLWYEPLVEIERGNAGRAIDLLLQQCRERSSIMIPFLRVDPLYDPLRADPRFADVLRCANLASPLDIAPGGAARGRAR